MQPAVEPAPADPRDLVRDLCHEVGNLLAAVRLSAYLIARERDGEALRADARDIDAAAAQAAAALSLLPPLLELRSGVPGEADVGEVLRAVAATLERMPGLAARIEGIGAAAPPLRAEADALHHLLVALVLSAWEAEGGKEGGDAVAVGLETREAEAVLSVEDRAGPWPGTAGSAPNPGHSSGEHRGRALIAAAATTLVHRWGGRLRILPRPGGARVEVGLPWRTPPPQG